MSFLLEKSDSIISKISLGRNGVEDNSVRRLSKALAKNTSLEHLRIESEKIHDISPLIAVLRADNHTLKSCIIDGVRIPQNQKEELAAILQERSTMRNNVEQLLQPHLPINLSDVTIDYTGGDFKLTTPTQEEKKIQLKDIKPQIQLLQISLHHKHKEESTLKLVEYLKNSNSLASKTAHY
jgi:hypothetical protein